MSFALYYLFVDLKQGKESEREKLSFLGGFMLGVEVGVIYVGDWLIVIHVCMWMKHCD